MSVSGSAIERSGVRGRVQVIEILRVESSERSFNGRTESGYTIAHALA